MAVIIGAGPSGLLLAHFLLSQSSQNHLIRGLLPLHIFERRDDPRTPLPLYKARQYVVGLSARGRDSISNIKGLWEEVGKVGVPSSQFVLHIGGREIALKRDPNKPSLLVNQRSLAAVLVNELQNRYSPELVQVTYGARCTDVDFDSQTVTIEKESKNKDKLSYDLLVGADGARSVVRRGFIGERGFDYQQINVPYTFKVLQVPRPVEISDGEAVHSFIVTDKETGKSFRFGCFPTPDKGTSVLISWSPETIPAELLEMQSPTELKAYVERFMPPLKVPLEAAEAFIAQRPTSSMQVRCSRFYSERGRAVLIGDAAHAMSNALGQGCNSSLKDVETLSDMLLQESDLMEALRLYSEQQVREDHAAAYVSQNAFPESKWLRSAYLFGNIVSAGLGKTPLQVILPPSIQSLCSETLTPYTEIANKNRSWLKLVEVTNLLSKSYLHE